MDRCLEHLVKLDSIDHDVEILVIDDGSIDETLAIAKTWQKLYPKTVRAIHQKNKGHGGAVNTGIKEAKGLYFKVVDSDDWLDEDAMQPIMKYLRRQMERKNPTDLVIGNYVYERAAKNEHTTIDYTTAFPERKEFGWDEVGKFRPGRYLLMHSVIFRTEILHKAKLKLPEHTFYVDSIFVHVPLPLVKTMYYFNIDMYRYQIGREDQSVNEEVMKGRIDQQLRVVREMIDQTDYEAAKTISPRLAAYQASYLSMMFCVSSAFLRLIGTPEADRKLEKLWYYLETYDVELYKKVRWLFPSASTNLPGPVGKWICTTGYRVMQKIFKFN